MPSTSQNRMIPANYRTTKAWAMCVNAARQRRCVIVEQAAGDTPFVVYRLMRSRNFTRSEKHAACWSLGELLAALLLIQPEEPTT